ncbi:MAG: DUF2000 domain-containing protein [Microcystaceae cyanobacterium]
MEVNANTHKIVAVINKNLEHGVALNAIAHMSLGLAARAAKERPQALEEMQFLNFQDKDGGDHAFISALSLIVLRGKSSEIQKLRQNLQAADLLYVDFTHQMTSETYVEQLERSRNTSEADLEYYGVCAFGAKSKLELLTKKFSLWR